MLFSGEKPVRSAGQDPRLHEREHGERRGDWDRAVGPFRLGRGRKPLLSSVGEDPHAGTVSAELPGTHAQLLHRRCTGPSRSIFVLPTTH